MEGAPDGVRCARLGIRAARSEALGECMRVPPDCDHEGRLICAEELWTKFPGMFLTGPCGRTSQWETSINYGCLILRGMHGNSKPTEKAVLRMKVQVNTLLR